MANDLTPYCAAGYAAPDAEPPHIFSSECWFGFRAGQAMRESGFSAPTTARMSRGYSVRAFTWANEFLISFSGERFTTVIVKRL